MDQDRLRRQIAFALAIDDTWIFAFALSVIATVFATILLMRGRILR